MSKTYIHVDVMLSYSKRLAQAISSYSHMIWSVSVASAIRCAQCVTPKFFVEQFKTFNDKRGLRLY